MPKLLLPLLLAFTFPMGVIAQAALSPCTPPGGPGGQALAITRVGVGTPYTFAAVVKADMVNPQGVKTTSGVTTSFQARDSQGRTRSDYPGGCFLVHGEPRWDGLIQVNDPVADTFTSWRVTDILPRKIVTVKSGSLNEANTRTSQEEFEMARRLSQSSDHGPDAKIHLHHKVEDLGKRTIAGLEASGMRITKTFPAGSLNKIPQAAQYPNKDRSFTEVEERWISDKYRFILLDNIDSEVTGVSSYEVTNFTLGEPDPSLFQPPADYSIATR